MKVLLFIKSINRFSFFDIYLFEDEFILLSMDNSTSKRLNELGVTGHGYKSLRNPDIGKLIANKEIKNNVQAIRFLFKLLDNQSFRAIKREFEIAALFGMMRDFNDKIGRYLNELSGDLDLSIVVKLVEIFSILERGDIQNIVKSSEKFSDGYCTALDLLATFGRSELNLKNENCYIDDMQAGQPVFGSKGGLIGIIRHSNISTNATTANNLSEVELTIVRTSERGVL